ncbi:uncharacterized protein EV154DRAFT_582859 [Mucor mucedo]|uniref:uncharacterized protein n=1 Tax=Mucor mucedo TaxID=29922 RepID=UPI00221F6C01|nr:uncharacterized protein EV154DRAFT_582859 [Mucor mucedo]KAI7893509.1 hypothetical protein EV154DRAFT_582859 [Mucor mucedo]
MSTKIQPYSPIPVTVTGPIEIYKTVIRKSVSKYGVKWNFNKHQDAPTGSLNGMQRQPTYVFREYFCMPFAEEKQEDRMPSHSESRLSASFSNGILYAIVTRHPLTGTGCPVAFFFTIDQSMVVDTELGAIQEVYPSASVQWCLSHVAGAWTGKIRQLVKLGDTHNNNTNQNKPLPLL